MDPGVTGSPSLPPEEVSSFHSSGGRLAPLVLATHLARAALHESADRGRAIRHKHLSSHELAAAQSPLESGTRAHCEQMSLPRQKCQDHSAVQGQYAQSGPSGRQYQSLRQCGVPGGSSCCCSRDTLGQPRQRCGKDAHRQSEAAGCDLRAVCIPGQRHSGHHISRRCQTKYPS